MPCLVIPNRDKEVIVVTAYEIVMAIVQIVTMSALVIALLLTRNEYKARMRPYIGFGEIRMIDVANPDKVEFEVNVRNIGQIPAKNAKLHGKFLITGEEDVPFECETKGSVFPSPDPQLVWVTGITGVDKDAILNRSKTLQLNLTVDYYGSGKENYWTSSTRIYDPSVNGWASEEGNWK